MDLDYEALMIQARLLSPYLTVMEDKGFDNTELSKRSGIEEYRIKLIFSGNAFITMEEIAMIQEALDVIAQPPFLLTKEAHKKQHYEG